jgi:hypothetical protein
MRRLIVSFLAATLLALFIALPAAAQGPERIWFDEEQLRLGEEYCGFPALLDDDFSKAKALIFPPDEDGNQRIIQNGVIQSTFINLDDPDRSINLNLGGKITIHVNADGTLQAQASGTFFAWYGPAEAAASELGVGVFLVHGRGTESYDSAGNLVEATAWGQVTDLCAELSS